MRAESLHQAAALADQRARDENETPVEHLKNCLMLLDAIQFAGMAVEEARANETLLANAIRRIQWAIEFHEAKR